jgi:hypothetical protein
MPEPTRKFSSTRSLRRLLPLFYLLPVLFVLGVCGYLVYGRLAHRGPPPRKISAAPFATVKIQGLDAHLFTQGDTLLAAGNDLFIEFRDAQGKLVDVGAVTLVLVLQMPSSVMRSTGIVNRTATPGQYRTTLEPGMAGEWKATLGIDGSRGQAEADFKAQVR